MITDAEFNAANNRAKRTVTNAQVATAVHYNQVNSRIVITFSSGIELSVAPERVQGLEKATAQDLINGEITPSGLGVYFPTIDADVYIPSLLQGLLGTEKWMSELGKKGGSATSDAKIAAARRNGKLGGRPKSSPLVTP
jgi:hypothetical protein